MTILVALSTKDALVMGCDSLGTVSVDLVPVWALIEFFDRHKDFKLKLDAKGKPILEEFTQVYNKARQLPYDHMTHVNKLFSMSPLPMGVMYTGILSIGDRTIKSLVAEFKTQDAAFTSERQAPNYTVRSIAGRLKKFIWEYYSKEYQTEAQRRDAKLELIIGGYSKREHTPKIFRILLHQNKIKPTIDNFGIVFGGQMREIQRIVFGTDDENKVGLIERSTELLEKYRKFSQDHLRGEGYSIDLPSPDSYGKDLYLFDGDWDLDGFDANWGDFSEQNAIECVDFFTDIMIKSQQFSSSLPTVGGEVHIALITKQRGFRFVSKEELQHKGHAIIGEQEAS